MRVDPQEYREIRKFLKSYLRLSDKVKDVINGRPINVDDSLAPDIVFNDESRRYYVAIAPKLGLNKLAQLSLYRDLLKAENTYYDGDVFLLVYKTASEKAVETAGKIGVKTVRAPYDLPLSGFEKRPTQAKTKLTTKKSWDIIVYLIRHQSASIYQVSRDTGVSYGWTHAVITDLMERGVVAKEHDYITVVDLNKLLNGIAWERPFERMKAAETWVDYDTAYSAAAGISQNLKSYNERFAFNGPTAGGLYTGRVIRHDTVYVYLEKENIGSFLDTFSTPSRKGIKVKIYVPDRDVFNDLNERESVMVTSAEQTLLDLACAGYGNLELTKAMVDHIASR